MATKPPWQTAAANSHAIHRERPVIFSGPMVKAILRGAKTQTRRIIKPQPADDIHQEQFPSGVIGWKSSLRHDYGNTTAHFCPYGEPSDLLWVREAHALRLDVDPATDLEKAKHYLIYRAGYDGDLGDEFHGYSGWRPSIHMPQWASRITLKINEVRVQRVQEISEDDVQAEGCTGSPYGPKADVMLFPTLWDSINGPGAWERNDFVWALTFERIPS